MRSSLPAVILFDLGGVLIEVAGAARTVAWARLESDRELWPRLAALPEFQEFEMGRLPPEAFAEAVCAALGLPVDASTFLEDFAGWPTRAFPGAAELLAALKPQHALACLSNNNAVHWARVEREMGIAHFFEPRFLSHEIGLVKPDPAIYRHVIDALALPPEAILFLDDNPANVEQARALGINAHRVFGVAAAAEQLRAHGIAVA
jgi:putative hydrolase of the HAD superfamily